MDGPEGTKATADAQQSVLAEALNRRRASAIRDFEDVLDRARNDLAFKIGKVISYAINDATSDDPSACACAFFTAERSVKRTIREYDWVIRRAWRAFQRALADYESRP